eukprot:COSAG06_NODE_80_length_25388_cov_33.371545_26_plen_98_part_00
MACVGLFWGAVGHGRARCELVVYGHCNAVNNHLDDVRAVWRASGRHTMALESYEAALGWLGSENRKSSIRVLFDYVQLCTSKLDLQNTAVLSKLLSG